MAASRSVASNKYQRLMVEAGKHHNSSICRIATTLLTRIIACWRTGQHHQLRDGPAEIIGATHRDRTDLAVDEPATMGQVRMTH